MAENIVAGLFGMTPQMYQNQQYGQDLNRGIALAQLSPGAAAQAGLQASVGQLGRGIAGAMGIEDPQLQMIAKRQQILSQLDLTDAKSLIDGAKLATSIGDSQLAVGLIDRAKSLAESSSKIALTQAQTLKALQPDKLTGDERYINALRIVENKLQKGEKPTSIELSNANISGQMLSKPRSYFDQASGQMVTQAATDPSKAFPLAYKEMGTTTEEGATTVPKPTIQQATAGNIPSASQKEIGVIDASLKKLELSTPELQSFLGSLKSNEVKYNAKDNTFDLLGAIVPPAFGFKEQGGQVKKDEIKRALTERVNSLLLMANGTQTEGDANRAKDQIADSTTYLSQARMIGAIEGLIRTEAKLSAELGVKKTALQSQGRTEAPGVPTSTPVTQPQAAKPAQPKSGESTREQKIQRFIDFNGGKPTRQEAIDALTKAGKL